MAGAGDGGRVRPDQGRGGEAADREQAAERRPAEVAGQPAGGAPAVGVEQDLRLDAGEDDALPPDAADRHDGSGVHAGVRPGGVEEGAAPAPLVHERRHGDPEGTPARRPLGEHRLGRGAEEEVGGVEQREQRRQFRVGSTRPGPRRVRALGMDDGAAVDMDRAVAADAEQAGAPFPF